MTPSEARARESREWLAKADEDLGSARVLIGSGHIANALFFCQQAAEKSLKAFLTWHEQAFRRTHDLEELGEACRAIDGTLAALLEQADVLSAAVLRAVEHLDQSGGRVHRRATTMYPFLRR